MRLTNKQIRLILKVVHGRAGDNAAVFLFGSRLDDTVRGGDIDILIESDEPVTRIDQAKIKMDVEAGLGLPVDVIVRGRGETPTPFQRIAMTDARRLSVFP